jgi:hypothetical protein
MKNKLICLAIITICSYTSICAQTDTTFVTAHTEQGALEKQTFVEQYEYVFLNKEPQRYMLKWNAAASIPVLSSDWEALNVVESFNDFILEGAFELKITPLISLNSMVVVKPNGKFNIFKVLDFTIEPRLYFNQKNRIKHGKSANNMTGTYFGLNFLQKNKFHSITSVSPSYTLSKSYIDYAATLRIGVQQRIFKRGYLDFSWGIGKETKTSFNILPDRKITTYNIWRGHIDQKLTLGMAFGKTKKGNKDNRACDFFQCFNEENRILKLDLLGLIRRLSTQEQSGRLSVAFEQKLKESVFSVQYEANLLASNVDFGSIYRQFGFGGGASVEGRWYYSMKKRIANGKSGNNLNGTFVGLHFANNYSILNIREYGNYRFYKQSFQVLPVLGIQYKIFKRGFFEFKAGIGFSKYSNTQSGDLNFKSSDVEPALLSELKIGLAF